MTRWIKTTERLPEEKEYCWLYGKSDEDLSETSVRYVFEGRFDSRSYEIRGCKFLSGPGWELDGNRSDYVLTDRVSHWMPYYTPEPPND